MINTNNSGSYGISGNSENKETQLTCYRLSPWEEVIGPVLDLKQNPEGFFAALIGKVLVALPDEIGSQLQGLQGQRIGILRTDIDYRMRIINA